MSNKILFVEDEKALREVLLEAATLEGYHAEGVSSAEAALELLSLADFDIVVTDVMLGVGMSGLDLLTAIRRIHTGILTIVITAHGTIEMAVEAMKRGASDFIMKPFHIKTLSSVIRVADERVAAKKRAAIAVGGSSEGEAAAAAAAAASSDFVGTSAVMLKLLDQVKTIAPFNTTVLVTGETGTGKELVARQIHLQSLRRNHTFVALNCAAVPEQLLEDELFGHVKGAFTGAQTAREGRFEQAHGGTLFLDEIGDMSLPLQSKLLRVLQEREFERLGSSRTIKVDVRIVAATSANLLRRIEANTFRPDLYYRLNVVQLTLPPLRERASDVRSLAETLLARFCRSAGLPAKTIDEPTWNVLTSYCWPGNVRQLQNAMERAAALSGSSTVIGIEDLPEEVCAAAATYHTPSARHRIANTSAASPTQETSDKVVSFDEAVTNLERELLLQSLSKTGGNKMRAAKLLNMKRTTFVEKLKRLRIEDAAKFEETEATDADADSDGE